MNQQGADNFAKRYFTNLTFYLMTILTILNFFLQKREKENNFIGF